MAATSNAQGQNNFLVGKSFPKSVLRMAAAMAVYCSAQTAHYCPGAQSHCLATSTTWRPGADLDTGGTVDPA